MNDQIAAITANNVIKHYGSSASPVIALKNISLEIHDNEFFTLLGPSGCGKATLLRLIAVFEQVTDGKIMLFDDEIANLEPNRRAYRLCLPERRCCRLV